MTSNSNQLNRRNVIIDKIKGIAMILIVLGHCGFPYDSFVNSFSVTVFFICAGFTYNESYSNDCSSIIRLIKNKIKSLYCPYVLYNLVFLLLNNFFIKLNLYTTNNQLLNLENQRLAEWIDFEYFFYRLTRIIIFNASEEFGGASWFIHALFIMSIAFCLILYITKKIAQSKYHDYIMLFNCLLMMIIGNYLGKHGKFMTYHLGSICSCIIFFYFGYLCKKYNVLQFLSKKYNHIICLMVSFIILSLTNSVGYISINLNQYPNIFYLFIVTIFGFLLIYSSSIIQYNSYVAHVLEKVGQNTMSILFLHFLSFKIVSIIIVYLFNLDLYYIASFPVLYGELWYLYLVIGVTFPVVFNDFINKIIIHFKFKQKKEIVK